MNLFVRRNNLQKFWFHAAILYTIFAIMRSLYMISHFDRLFRSIFSVGDRFLLEVNLLLSKKLSSMNLFASLTVYISETGFHCSNTKGVDDVDTFEDLLEAERISVERFVRFRINSIADADDVLQEILPCDRSE